MARIVKGYVLINTAVGQEKDVMNNLMELPEVKEVHLLAGDFDVLAELECETILEPIHLANADEQLVAFVTEKVRKVSGITRTRTVIPVVGRSEQKEYIDGTGKAKKGFVFVGTSPGKESKVTKELLKIPEVQQVHLIPGNNDLLAVVWVQRYVYAYQDSITSIVIDEIQKIKGIERTETYIPEETRTKPHLQVAMAR